MYVDRFCRIQWQSWGGVGIEGGSGGGIVGGGDTEGYRLWEIRVKGGVGGLPGLCMLKEGFGVVSS